jgi:hypothetical protein
MVLSLVPVLPAKASESMPVVEYVKAPILEYKVGDIVEFDLHAPNYNGRVQYRVILWDGNKKEARDLWTTGDRYYSNWIPDSNTVFNLHWKIDEPGVYRITVYVKRAGIKNSSTALSKYNCDSYMESQPFVVKEKEKEKATVFDKNEQTYGSTEQNKAEVYNRDISISGKNVTFNNAELKGNLSITGDNTVIKNVNVSGKIIIDPGKDGSCTLENVTTRNIQVLSGGCNSIHIKNAKAETMNIDSKNTVRIEVDGDTEIVSVQANGYVIFDKKSGKFNSIIIAKNENGESVVELRGDIQDKIVVEGAAYIKTAQASRIANLVINTKSSTDKVKLEGNYDRVEVNSIAKLELKGNTKLKSLVANKDTEVTMDKTAVITDVEKNNNDVVIIKEGGSKENTEPKDNSGSYIPPTILVTNIAVTSDGNIDTVIKGKTLQMNAAAAPANAENKTIVWTVSQGTEKATIDKLGLLTAVEAGSATVKAANPDSGVSGTKVINIVDDPALIAEYTNAANAEAIKAVLNENKLGLTLTDYDGLDDPGKLEVAAKLFSVKATLTTKALIQASVTVAILESKLASIERTLVAEYTNAASVETVKILLDNNELKLDLTSYAKLGADGKSIVAAALYNKRASLTSMILIQDAVTSAMPVFITRIGAAIPNGAYKQGASINIAVDFSTNVTVTGTPVIHLDMSGEVKDAKYLSGSGTSTLAFDYTVQSGDNTSDLEYTGTDALDLNLGGIKSVDNIKDVFLTLPVPKSSNSLSGTSDIEIDTTHPGAITISIPNEIPANSSVTLNAEGGPLDSASWNDILSEIKANTGKGSNWITGVENSNLSIVPNGSFAALKNNSNAKAVIEADFIISKTKIYDKAGNYSDTDIVINSHIMSKIIGVNSSSADGYYKAGGTISINVAFDEPVDVTGSPALCLETGVNDRLTNYISSSGTNTLTFSYTVQTGDTSNDLDYTSENALIFNGGRIKVKGSDMDANLTLPLPGTERSLGGIKDIRIDAIIPAGIDVSSQNIIPGGKEITLTAVDGILDYFSWESILNLIRSNTSSGENWITGISSTELQTTLNCNGINATLSGPKDAVINRDFIIPKNLVADEAGNMAVNDIRIDSCNSVTDIAIADKYAVFEVNNTTPDLYVAYAKTVGQLKNALKAVDNSPQTYVVADSTGTLKDDNSIILLGDVLTVTSESGLSNKSFPIRVAPEPVTTIQLNEAAVNASSITIDNTKGSESYMVIRLFSMTVGQIKSGLKSTSVEAPQTYEIIDSSGNVMTDEQNVCTGAQLNVTAYDGVAKASYEIFIDLSIIKVEDISVDEGDSGTVDAVFTIRRIGPISSPLTIGYQFDYYDGLGKNSPYNASHNVDYTCGESHDVTFNANESTKTFIVKICGDIVKEENEKFQLIFIDNYLGAEIRSKATCTIIDNDGDK